jgi:two-component SAPR family response regulator
VISIGWNKAREVFFYLLAHPNGSSLDELRDNIWPDLSAQRSREALRTAIYQIRSVFPRDFIVLHGRQIYKIDRNIVNIEYDVEMFLSHHESAEKDPLKLISAINLYQGPFLPSSDNQWSTVLRSHLEQQYLHMIHTAARHYELSRHVTDALLLYKRILAVDNFDEVAHTGIMRCQIALGNRAAAIEQYHLLRQLLDEELGLNPKPSSEIEQLYLQMLADA